MARETAEKCVFGKLYLVGNIPYDASEESLKAFFECVGPVVSFRLIKDKDTNKPRGYGFCEFKAKEYARSAIRNMNDVEFNGRSLRVDYSQKHKNVLNLIETSRNNTLQQVMSRLSLNQGYYLFSILQNYATYSYEDLAMTLKNRPYVLFALLKLMHRMNSEYSDSRPRVAVQEGLLPLPTEEHFFLPSYNMRPF